MEKKKDERMLDIMKSLEESHEVYKEQYKSLPLPIIIQSSSREFNKREENE